MIEIDISAGFHILEVCANAASLARHIIASKHEPGACYAFGKRAAGKLDLDVGPWVKPTDLDEPFPGAAFWDHCRDLGYLGLIRCRAIDGEPGVCFVFNDVTVVCEAVALDDPRTTGDIAAALVQQWEAKCEAAYNAYWTPERKAQAARAQAGYDAEMAKRRERIASALARYPFEPTDPDAYSEYKRINADGYSSAVVRYGEAWAALMEEQLALGFDMAEAAETTRDEADCEGITGFMYGCAVSQLALFWKHGERLRVWHNAEYGATGSGVVNPAVITIKG